MSAPILGRPYEEEAGPRMTAYLTALEVATLFRVSREWVYRNRVELGSIKVGRNLRFSADGLARYERLHRVAEQVPGVVADHALLEQAAREVR